MLCASAARARAITWMFAALNTVEPPILELQTAALVEGDKSWSAQRLPLVKDRIRDRLGIDYTRSNVLEIESGPNCGQLTGRMVDQPWGDICDGAEKRKMLLETCAQLGISPRQAIAMGDGANDLPMMGVAGLSVAYHAKPKVREQDRKSVV